MILKTDTENLTIELHGKEQLLAVKAKVIVPKNTIITCEWRETFHEWRKWEVRLPGAGIPKRVIAGSFWTEEGWDFLYLLKPHSYMNPFVHSVLFIETTENKFKRIVVSCNKEEADKIAKWAKKK
jgi:hypothetical protein